MSLISDLNSGSQPNVTPVFGDLMTKSQVIRVFHISSTALHKLLSGFYTAFEDRGVEIRNDPPRANE